MTHSPKPARKMIIAFFRAWGPELALLLLACVLRLDGIGFGLPALNDPDEPLFMMLAFGMLQRGSLDPQWFGHPATTTLYCLAAILVAVAGAGIASGQYAGVAAFGQAVYADPSIVMVPARLFIAANSVACVWLTYRIGRDCWGRRAGLIAGLLLAINAVHISWSQVVRTDVQASLFMLLCIRSAIAIMRDGSMRSHVAAGVFAGLACATKWPGALVILAPLAAGCWGLGQGRSSPRRLAALIFAAAATLLVISPYLLISWDVVLANLAGEARTDHPGANGHGLAGNLAWYAAGPLAQSFGWVGLAAAAAGIALATIRSRPFRLTVMPVLAAFVLLICVQNLVWERWLVPVLPFFALGLAWGMTRAAAVMTGRLPAGRAGAWLAAGILILPMLGDSMARKAERAHDTRQIASQWLRAHAPPGSTIMVEHAALDLLNGPWKLVFPLGSAGCVDARAALSGRLSVPDVDKRRQGSPVVDLAHVPVPMLVSCRADFLVISHLRRYEAERHRYPLEYARYRRVLGHGRLLADFEPVPGQMGGPDILIYDGAAPDHGSAPGQ